MALDIVTIGDSVVDIIISVPRFPRENEETVYSDGMLRQLGGSSNLLIMASRLGLKTGVIDLLGDDDLETYYRTALAGEGVDVSRLIKSEGAQTAHCICLVDDNGEHAYISFPGATGNLTDELIDQDYIASSRVLYISGYSLTKSPIREATIKALRVAKENGLKIYFDPSPVIELVPSDTLQEVIRLTDCILLNEREQSVIHSKLPEIDLGQECALIVLKQGAGGCTVEYKGELLHFQGHQVAVKDTTGAGDVFNAAFIYGQLEGWSINRSARFANLLAAEKIKRLGAGLNMPTRKQAAGLKQVVMG